MLKVCDLGFARPYLENETFTDYVATRWYRSPELLVGDPRYGKEVDIWAVGCLYSEMMTGEPLFPGESDIDQLFQIVRILGKLNARHQVLIMRNAMFKGMKQEQNTSLAQMFPDWNRDSLDFLADCLKMDGAIRPDAAALLKHELFMRDSFLENFLPELRAKLAQEMQVNPLLNRIPSYGSGRKGSDEKQRTIATTATMMNVGVGNAKKSGETTMAASNGSNKEKNNQINLSLLPSSQIKSNQQPNTIPNSSSNGISNVNISYTNVNSSGNANSNNMNGKNHIVVNNSNNANSTNSNNHHHHHHHHNGINIDHTDEVNQVTASSLRPYLNGPGNNQPPKSKPISINNLVFKENAKYPRILSAKSSKANGNIVSDKLADHHHHHHPPNGIAINNFDMQILPPSPIPFQSLQIDSYNTLANGSTNEVTQTKRLSPVNGPSNNTNNSNSSNGLSISGGAPQYFTNYRRSSNILGLQQMAAAQKSKAIQAQNAVHHHLPAPASRNSIVSKRERDRGGLPNHLDVSLVPIGFNSGISNTATVVAHNSDLSSAASHSGTISAANTTAVAAIINSNSNIGNATHHQLTKESSPRILPPPPWLMGNSMTTQGKPTQMASNNSKRRMTDWKTISNKGAHATAQRYHGNENLLSSGSDLILPNCPGATISPQKSSNAKKKLTPISTLSESTNVFNTPVSDDLFENSKLIQNSNEQMVFGFMKSIRSFCDIHLYIFSLKYDEYSVFEESFRLHFHEVNMRTTS